MKEIIHNDDNLREEEITEHVIRAKALIINDGTILIANENSLFEFPGGHLDEGETIDECLKREVLEETGIELDDSEIKGIILKATYMNRDWPEKGKNRKNEIYYYVVETNKHLDMSKVTLTEAEIKHNLKIETFPLKDSINIIKNNIPNNERNEILSPDMTITIEEYLKEVNYERKERI